MTKRKEYAIICTDETEAEAWDKELSPDWV